MGSKHSARMVSVWKCSPEPRAWHTLLATSSTHTQFHRFFCYIASYDASRHVIDTRLEPSFIDLSGIL